MRVVLRRGMLRGRSWLIGRGMGKVDCLGFEAFVKGLKPAGEHQDQDLDRAGCEEAERHIAQVDPSSAAAAEAAAALLTRIEVSLGLPQKKQREEDCVVCWSSSSSSSSDGTFADRSIAQDLRRTDHQPLRPRGRDNGVAIPDFFNSDDANPSS